MATKTKSQNKNNQVNKAFSPDEMALVEDLQSTVTQLLSLQGGNAPGQENETEIPEDENNTVEMADDVMTDDEDEEEGAVEDDMDDQTDIMKELRAIKGMLQKKQCAQKTDDEDEDDLVEKSETGRDTADERLNPSTMVNDETLPVKKALDNLLKITKSLEKPKKNVNKTPDVTRQVQKSMAPIVAAITEIAKAVNTQGKATANILDALGFTEKIEESIKVEKSKDTKPVRAIDNSAIVDVFTQMLQAVQKNNPEQQVAKSADTETNRRERLNEAMRVALLGNKE